MPPGGTLGDLVEKAEIRGKSIELKSDLAAVAASRAFTRKLSEALMRETVAVIAEIKRSSPSKGSINSSLDSVRQARLYERGGAAAISVLTEPERFGGSDEDIESVMTASTLPILKKDFHVTPAQVAHAATLGVSAALVIVRAVNPARLRELATAGRDTGLELLFEVRDEWELESALDNDALLIGVNNRNLETLEIDPSTVSRIVPLIPGECIAVAESGYTSRDKVETAAKAGADAVLVGSSLSASDDPSRAVAEIASVRRRGRDRDMH
jgi:indole-3-glycerol phosphate synthase